MNKLAYSLLFSILLHSVTKAQVFDWADSHQTIYNLNPAYPETPLEYDGLGHVIHSRIDSVAVTYNSAVYGQSFLEIRDTNGVVMHQVSMGPQVNIQRIAANSLGEIYVGGTMRQTLYVGGTDTLPFINGSVSGNNTFIIKLDTSGQVLWMRNLEPVWPTHEGIEALATSPSGNCWYAMTDYFTGIIIEMDSQGTDLEHRYIQNAKRIGNISFDPAGAMYVSGAAENGWFIMGLDSFPVVHTYNMFIARYDAAGNPSWAHFGADITFQKPNVIADNMGNGLFVGTRFDTTSFNGYSFTHPPFQSDFFMFKMDAAGNVLWGLQQPPLQIGPFGVFEPGPNRSLGADAAGNLYVGGVLRGFVDWGNGLITTTSGIMDSKMAVVCVNSAGSVQWAKLGGGFQLNYLHSVSVSDAGSVYLTGAFGQSATFDTIQFNNSNNYNFLVAKIRLPGPLAVQEPDLLIPGIWPNPASGAFYISGLHAPARVQLFGPDGRLVFETGTETGNVTLPSGVTNGCYLVVVKQSDAVTRYKLVVH